MTPDPFPTSRFVAGYDEPPAEARVRALVALALLTPQPVLGDGGRPRLAEFDFDPIAYDPVARWEAVITVEICPECERKVEAGEHVAVTARGRRLCVECGT